MRQPPTAAGLRISDIAKQLGVSSTTVSLALHNHPRISLSRRRQIQRAAKRMGYRPNPMATALVQQRFDVKNHAIAAEIAWINYWHNPKDLRCLREFDLYWKGASKIAEQCGYRLEEIVCSNCVTPRQLEKILLARNIRGIIIPPHRDPDIPEGWNDILWEKFSIVRIGFSVKYPPVQVVAGNHLASGYMAFENIEKLGYQRIGLVTSRSMITRDKAGFLMKQLELPAKQRVPVLQLSTGADRSLDFAPLVSWLKKNKPDSILTDIACLHERLKQMGYRIPQDIGLATTSVLDGNADAGIDQNSEHIGKASAEMVISQINHNYYGIPKVCRELLIEGKWVNGNTLPRK